MPVVTKTTHRQHLRNMVGPVAVVLVVYVLAAAVFTLAFGPGRLHDDFWPVDASRIGPNLVASFTLVLALVAHNEWVTEERARQRHETHRKMVDDLSDALLHPTEDAEAALAASVEADFRDMVTRQLDETTPGGLGTIAAALTPTKRTMRKGTT